MKEKIDGVKERKEEKRRHLADINKVKDQINALTAERDTLRKQLHRDHQDPTKIQKAIEEMEKRYKTTTLKSNNDEKKLLLEIKTLKDSLPAAEKLLELKPRIDELYGRRKEISEILNGIQADIDARDAEIDTIKKDMDEAKEKRADIKEQVDKFESDIA